MWLLTGPLAPDFKMIADFRRDNAVGIRDDCRRFVELCGYLKLFSEALAMCQLPRREVRPVREPLAA